MSSDTLPSAGDLPLAFQTPPTQQPSTPLPPPTPSPVDPPPLPLKPVKKSSPLVPLLIGSLLMLLGVAGAAVAYYFRYLATPAPVNQASPTPSPIQAVTENFMSSTPSASLAASPVASPQASATAKPAASPRLASPLSSPVASPVVSRPTLDLTFGNPSATGEETVESGGSRTTYRSFTSIESAQFVALTSGNPQLKVCFQVVSNEKIAGQSVAYVYVVDGTTAADTNLGEYGELEPNRMYSLCRDTSLTVGTHSVTLELNKAHTVGESSFTNNLARFDYTVVSQ